MIPEIPFDNEAEVHLQQHFLKSSEREAKSMSIGIYDAQMAVNYNLTGLVGHPVTEEQGIFRWRF